VRAELGKVTSVSIAGKVYRRLTGNSLRTAVVCKSFIAPLPQGYHGDGHSFGRNGQYLQLNDRYGATQPGRYVVEADFVSIVHANEPPGSISARLVFFRSEAGAIVFGTDDHPAGDWSPAQWRVEDACFGERG
jgi:hypothetical protein